MSTQMSIETVESIVRSFRGQDFSADALKSAMAQYPPRRRVSMIAASRILKVHRMAEPLEKKYLGGGSHCAITIWRPLI